MWKGVDNSDRVTRVGIRCIFDVGFSWNKGGGMGVCTAPFGLFRWFLFVERSLIFLRL